MRSVKEVLERFWGGVKFSVTKKVKEWLRSRMCKKPTKVINLLFSSLFAPRPKSEENYKCLTFAGFLHILERRHSFTFFVTENFTPPQNRPKTSFTDLRHFVTELLHRPSVSVVFQSYWGPWRGRPPPRLAKFGTFSSRSCLQAYGQAGAPRPHASENDEIRF